MVRSKSLLPLGPPAACPAGNGLIRANGAAGLDAALDAERDAQAALGRSTDYAEGVEAFAAKRPPNFVGR